jgi:hypothetical protein
MTMIMTMTMTVTVQLDSLPESPSPLSPAHSASATEPSPAADIDENWRRGVAAVLANKCSNWNTILRQFGDKAERDSKVRGVTVMMMTSFITTLFKGYNGFPFRIYCKRNASNGKSKEQVDFEQQVPADRMQRVQQSSVPFDVRPHEHLVHETHRNLRVGVESKGEGIR